MTKIIDIINSNRNDANVGIYSVCCAQPLVIEAAIKQAIKDNTVVLIEATANQVNQFGGYTSMKPVDFVEFIKNIAVKLNFPFENIILGGDHLGPVCWVDENAAQALEKSKTLIQHYVAAGFKKIHLDTSMPCADDDIALSDEIIAERAAILCEVAEKTAKDTFGHSDIVYVVGTEVPPPGGATEEITSLDVTPTENVEKTLSIHLAAFNNKGLQDAWQRVIGIVVQPGVEFDHTSIIDYDSEKAQPLSQFIKTVPNIVFEAHSTDYQKPTAYQSLVTDHFGILKVGPQLTFAMREALFALSYIEQAYIPSEQRANLMDVIEEAMLTNPVYWQKFYHVAPADEIFYRRYSYSDRIRYYWNTTIVEQAVEKLLNNLTQHAIPLPLISQYLPEQYQALRAGTIKNCPRALIVNKIMQVTEVYASACNQQSQQ
ncbi:D-tagatose-bisphosphate aldolase, class II, non-catalytic subunit [Thalassotalea sediminis]|uniref:D-tagatose-bisphosphate aldolase, class II, non-catalytic subunit n=1 Tax=Thalassotalea sediminis TaxID=1759089 RepID=UPI00257451FC|nr:D-tagatose-bisphosphate aldolase, class II, non-catalytic subunit [Thalassotalea sediminis]